MVKKTDTPKETSGPGQTGGIATPTAKRTAKKSARKIGKSAAAAGKPKKKADRKTGPKKSAAKKGRKRAATATAEGPSIATEELAARRIAGGPNTETAPASVPSDSAPTEAKPKMAAQVLEAGRRGKTDPRTRPAGNAEGSPRPNTLVPTNGIHATERRLKRKRHHNHWVLGLIAATLLGIIILGEQTAPPNLTEFEQEIAASQAIETAADAGLAKSPPGIIQPNPGNQPAVILDPEAEAGRVAERLDNILNDVELVEMERLLARLDLGPSTVDGIVDIQTETAIRLYQEIAGLPIDGAPSRSLLADIREVVKILEDGG